jgi:NADH-quinone oxidoreductase subunit N
MNSLSFIGLELAVGLTALALLLIDLWTLAERKKYLGYAAALALGIILALSFAIDASAPQTAFNSSYMRDSLAMFFKRFFIVTAIIVLIMSVEFAERIRTGVTEFYAITLFALCGMMFAASANDLVMLFVSLELITVSFYVLTSFQRARVRSLESGVKYLIMGAVSSAFMVYGIALIFGLAGTTNFDGLAALAHSEEHKAVLAQPLFLAGVLLLFVGLCFKMAAFPVQIWTPDVYQGAPAPATAFLAVGSKAAGFVLLLRVLFSAIPEVAAHWGTFLAVIAAITILYGNLCALPQRNLKRLLGYSSIGNAGYLLLGAVASNKSGSSAILYYLAGYLFTVLAAFTVLSIITREAEDEDITILAGLNQRSPLLAASLALSMISLAGIPPLAGFFGKFLLLKSVVERGATQPLFLVLIGLTIVGIVISFYYYLGVVRAIYWSRVVPDYSEIRVSMPARVALYVCIAGMLILGLFPGAMVNTAETASMALKFSPQTAPDVRHTASLHSPQQ